MAGTPAFDKSTAGTGWFGRPASRLRVARYGGRRKVAGKVVASILRNTTKDESAE
ncbi:MAG: hypothetical protein NTX52_07595 [Planctomycetota bacterium]|nr:hypothetical protein [Planctomycetota bacterium]